MAPEFALFLSPDGIALAHRQPKGHWAVLADTPLDVDDLSVALTALRKRAEERADGKFTTLVVLPDDQVLFTSLTAPGPDEEDRLEQIRSGLEGLTPYPVEDLAFDYTPLEYGRVKLAVVARETLAEAESFAKEHGFEPAGFAARPVDNRFPGVALFDREPDWTASLTEIEFGRDSWPKSNAKPAEAAAAELAKEAVPEAEADRAPDKAEDAAKAATAKTKDAPAPKDEPKDEPKDRTDPPEAAEGADGPAPDPVTGDAVKAPSKAAKPATGTAAETTRDNAENAAQVQLSALSLPEGFGLRRDRDNPDDAVADRIGSRPPRFGISPPELSRGTATGDDMGDDTGDDTGDRPRFGRGETLPDPLDDPETSPARPSAAGPAPELPPLTRTKLQAQRASTSLSSSDPVPRPDLPPLSTATGAGGAAKPARRGRLSGMGKRLSAKKQSQTGAAPAPEAKAGAEAAPTPTPVGSIRSRLKTLARRPGAKNGTAADSAQERQENPAAKPATIAPPPATKPRRAEKAVGRKSPAPAAPMTDADASLTGGLLAREAMSRPKGPSLRAGLILTLILLAVLGLIAIWAALYLPDTALARWLGMGREEPVITVTEPAPEIAAPPALPEAGTAGDSVAGLQPEASAPEVPAETPEAPELLPDIDADLDLAPVAPRVDPETLLPTRAENEAFYARTGIWQRPPVIDLPVPEEALDDVLLASLDPPVTIHDAIALPVPAFNPAGDLPRRQTIPVDPDTEFVFDDNGLVVPEAEGALNPDGILIYAGTPEVTPRPRPGDNPAALAAAEAEADGTAGEADPTAGAIDTAVLAALRPDQRPADLQETRERQILGGISYSELARIRPDTRPDSIQELATAEVAESEAETLALGTDPAEITSDSPMAVAVSFVPPTRPANFAALVETAREADSTEPAPVVAASISDTVQPSVPSSASVTRAATQENAINLRRINLIGVSGSPSDRRALVRLPSGRFVTVERGDRLDGGQVAAIGENALQYIKRGRTITLEMPAG